MDTDRIKSLSRPAGLPFRIGKIGHVALYVQDLERSARFYTETLGFSVSDVYGDNMMPGGAVFLRCNADHHGIALFQAGAAPDATRGQHHMAWEGPTRDEGSRARNHLRDHGVPIDFEGRRRAGV